MFQLVTQNRSKCTERLTQRHRNGILQLCTAHLQHVLELFGFLLEAVNQCLIVLFVLQVSRIQTHMNSGGISVVGALAAVHVVIGAAVLIFACLVTHYLQCAVGYHFVGVHVGGRTCTALNHVHREHVVVLACQYLLASLFDALELFVCQQT